MDQLMEPLTDTYVITVAVAMNTSSLSSLDHDGFIVNVDSTLPSIRFLYFTAKLDGADHLQRDEFEEQLLETFIKDEILVEIFPGVTKAYAPRLIPTDYNFDLHICSHVLNISESDGDESYQCGFHVKHDSGSTKSRSMGNNEIPLNYHLSCPFVEFSDAIAQIDHYFYKTWWKEKILVSFPDIQLEFSGIQELNQITNGTNKTIQICKQLLDLKMKQFRTKEPFDLMAIIIHIESLVCLSVSIVCLTATLVTYVIFPSLRCDAGVNNMFLAGSLMVAQVLLMTQLHIQWPGKTAGCFVLGVATHLCWLLTFMWSFLCCLHMFRVFTAPTRPSHRKANPGPCALVKRFTASLVLPVVVITTMVISKLLMSQWSRTGYDGINCFLSDSYGIVIPMSLAITANIVLFTVVVVKIWRVRSLQTSDSFHNDSKQNLAIYVKLSTLTGMFWILSILAESLDVDALRLVVNVINGLQGTFLFLSFTCNRHVLSLYRCLLGFDSEKSSNTATKKRQTENRIN